MFPVAVTEMFPRSERGHSVIAVENHSRSCKCKQRFINEQERMRWSCLNKDGNSFTSCTLDCTKIEAQIAFPLFQVKHSTFKFRYTFINP